jgi:hypothetical protein
MFIRYLLIITSLILLASCCQRKVVEKHEVKQVTKIQRPEPERSINSTIDNINRNVTQGLPPKKLPN